MNRQLIDYARHGLPVPVPVFDAHAHIDGQCGAPAPSLAQQVEEMDRLGVKVAAISSTLALFGEYRRGNDNVAAACRAYPERFIGYCHVNGNFPELLADELARCFAQSCFRAIKLYQYGCRFEDPAYEPVWAFAAARGVPIMTHTWAGSFTGFETIAERYPEVPFIAAHGGSGGVFAPYLETARRLPNFYFDLTYSREHTNHNELLIRGGGKQVLWGSDYPVFSMRQGLAKILYCRCTEDEKRAVLYDNAARLFALP